MINLSVQIFVGGLDSEVTDDMLRESFIPFGEIVSVKIPVGRGCGFVQFAKRCDLRLQILIFSLFSFLILKCNSHLHLGFMKTIFKRVK